MPVRVRPVSHPRFWKRTIGSAALLDALFSLPDLGRHLIFKGGTSLSKVFRLIERFSEDIDVSFHRDFLGFGADRDPEAASGKEQVRRVDALRDAWHSMHSR